MQYLEYFNFIIKENSIEMNGIRNPVKKIYKMAVFACYKKIYIMLDLIFE